MATHNYAHALHLIFALASAGLVCRAPAVARAIAAYFGACCIAPATIIYTSSFCRQPLRTAALTFLALSPLSFA